MENEFLVRLLIASFEELPQPRLQAQPMAYEFVAYAQENAERLFVNCLFDARQGANFSSSDYQDAIQEYANSVRRYIVLILATEHGRPIDQSDAREITDFWTDTEILNPYCAADKVALQKLLECWQRDKEGGFYDLPEPQRAATQAGNYGAYIERIISKSASDSKEPRLVGATAEKAEIKAVLKNGLAGYFDEYSNIVIDTALNRKDGGKRAAAQMLLVAYYAAVDKAVVNSFAKWLAMWRPLIDINPKDGNYKECKISRDYWNKHQNKFSKELQKILYPEIFE